MSDATTRPARPLEATPSRRPGPPVAPVTGTGAGPSRGRPRPAALLPPFAAEVIQTAATAAGAAGALQRAATDAAGHAPQPGERCSAPSPAGRRSIRCSPRRRRRLAPGTGPDRSGPGRVARLPDRVPDGRRPDPVHRPAPAAGRARRGTPAPTAARWRVAIREMVVRGAPALGQAAAYGLALTAEHSRDRGQSERRALASGAPTTALRASRPTAVNIAWALDRMHGPDRGAGRSGRQRRRRRRRRCGSRPTRSAPRRPATTARWPSTACAVLPPTPGPRAPPADPLQHRAAGLRPVRDGARASSRRPGRPIAGWRSSSTRPGRTSRGPG